MAVDCTAGVRGRPQDEAAWDKWFKAVYPRVYFVLYRVTGGDASLSEECTQGAIVRFLRYQALKKVATDSDSVNYLTQTALRLLSDEYRANKVLVPLTTEESGERVLSIPSFDALDHLVEGLELDFLSKELKQPDRHLLALLRKGLTVGEIAKELGIAYSAAGVRIHRLKENLKKLATRM